MVEKWVAVKEYEGLYQVSNLGRVRSIDRVVRSRPSVFQTIKGRIIKPHLNAFGYEKFTGSRDGKTKNLYVHRLVATAFIDKPDGKNCINHIDNNPSNNRATNLEWCTHKENSQHMIKSNRTNPPVGARSASAKLTREQVLAIRSKSANGVKQAILAKEYGIHVVYVGSIVRRKNWKHI